jgi:hypothetical protein
LACQEEDVEKYQLQTIVSEFVGFLSDKEEEYEAPESVARTLSLSQEQLMSIGSIRPMDREPEVVERQLFNNNKKLNHKLCSDEIQP